MVDSDRNDWWGYHFPSPPDDDPDDDPVDDPVDDADDEPRLYAGKYKTVEEMERAYKEAESKITQASSLSAKMRQQIQQHGAYVDDEGNIIVSQQPTQQQPVNVTAQSINDTFWEDPGSATAAMVTNAVRLSKIAQANTLDVVGEYESDPMFRQVARRFQSELMKVDDAIMADPNRARQTAGYIYDSIVGQHVRTQAKAAKEDPAARSRIIDELGVGGPVRDSEPTSDKLTRTDMEMLKEMGLSAKEMRDAELSAKKGGGERERY